MTIIHKVEFPQLTLLFFTQLKKKESVIIIANIIACNRFGNLYCSVCLAV